MNLSLHCIIAAPQRNQGHRGVNLKSAPGSTRRYRGLLPGGPLSRIRRHAACHSSMLLGRGPLLAVPSALAPGGLAADPPDGSPSEAVAAGSGPLTTLATVETCRLRPRRAGTAVRACRPDTRRRRGALHDPRYQSGSCGRAAGDDHQAAALRHDLHRRLRGWAGSDRPFFRRQRRVLCGRVRPRGRCVRTATPTRAPRDYTHVRWLLSRPLAAGATALLRFRATLELKRN